MMRFCMCYLCPVLLFLSFVVGCDISDTWQYEKGIILAEGSDGLMFKNANGGTFSLTGHRRVSKTQLDEVSAFHLVVLNGDPSVAPGGNESTRTQFYTLTKINWLSKQFGSKVTRSLEFKYDGRHKTLVIGDQEFSTLEQNMFRVTIGPEWRITTVQLNGKIEKRVDAISVWEKFKEIDKTSEIQAIEVAQ